MAGYFFKSEVFGEADKKLSLRELPFPALVRLWKAYQRQLMVLKRRLNNQYAVRRAAREKQEQDLERRLIPPVEALIKAKGGVIVDGKVYLIGRGVPTPAPSRPLWN